jgi:hypothetical protein
LQDTRGKDQGAFGIPLPFMNAREFPRHHQDNPVADSPFGRIVHQMWVHNHTIIPPLPDAVVSNAPIQVTPIVAMDRVAIDRTSLIVARMEELASQILFFLDIPNPHRPPPPLGVNTWIPPSSFVPLIYRLKLS